jgi:hypothetical protein
MPPHPSRRHKEREMPARDLYHEAMSKALVKDGWTITHDPLTLHWGKKDYFVDLGAERLLGASKEGQKIAVEEMDTDRELFLAIRQSTFHESFDDGVGKLILDKKRVRLIIFDDKKEEVVKWLT